MILWNRTNIYMSENIPVLAAERGLVIEGNFLVKAQENGITKVKRSTATTTELLAGVAMQARRNFNVLRMIETVSRVGAGTIDLRRTAVGTIGAYNIATGAAIAVTGSAASSTNINAATVGSITQLTITVDFTATPLLIMYDYASTSTEDDAIVGQYPGQFALDALDAVGVVTNGLVYTDKFSTSGNWFAGVLTLKSIATGQVTDGASGTGTALTGRAELVSAPSADLPYLGVRLF